MSQRGRGAGRGSFGGIGASTAARGFSHAPVASTSSSHASSSSNQIKSENHSSQRGGRGRGRGGRGGRGGGFPKHHDNDDAGIDWELVMPPEDQRFDIIDIGANLAHKRFSYDWQQVVDQAVVAGVKQIIITGTSVRDSIRASELAKQKPGILYSTAGVHPHDAKSCDENTIKTLRELASNPHVVAIGECGLDFDRNFSPKDVQLKWFEEQIRLAIEVKKPLFLHERAAGRDFIDILNKFPKETLPRMCVHCFTGDSAEAKRYLDLGCYLGITGWINDPVRGKDLQKAVKLIPLDRLMIETDAPFLAPKDIPNVRISRNEPGVLPQVLRKVADCLGLTAEEVAIATSKTTKEFFGL